MKIAIAVGRFPVISETFILNQITGLLDLGHGVDIFAFANGNCEKIHEDVIKYDLLRKVYYFDIPQIRFKRIIKALNIILRYFTLYPKEIILCLNFSKFGGIYNMLNNLFKMEPFLKRKYDIIHCHFGPNGNELVFLKYLFPKIKFVTAFHGYDITKFVLEHGEDVYKNLFEQGDLFLPISNRWKEKLLRFGCNPHKILVHRMGVDLQKFKPTHIIEHHKKEQIIILTIARLVGKKGLEYSISAVAKILKKCSNIRYSIIGDGQLNEQLKNLISELGAEDRINLLGWLESDKVKDMLYQSDIFLLSSVTSMDGDQEGIPVSIMEAMAVGLPVIATHHSGIPELVSDGKSGFLIPEKNIDAIVEKILFLIEHPEICVEMGKAGRKFIEENYAIEKLNKSLADIYQK